MFSKSPSCRNKSVKNILILFRLNLHKKLVRIILLIFTATLLVFDTKFCLVHRDFTQFNCENLSSFEVQQQYIVVAFSAALHKPQL